MAIAQDKKYIFINLTRGLIQTIFLIGLFSCHANNQPGNDHPGTINFVDAKFVDCVFYAGSTQFFFQHKNGEEFMVSQSHEPDALKIINADSLIEPNPVEGPPGPNTEILGKLIRIHYDKQGKPIAFSQLE